MFLPLRKPDDSCSERLTTQLSSGGAPVSCGHDKRIMPRRLLQRLVRPARSDGHSPTSLFESRCDFVRASAELEFDGGEHLCNRDT
jgi:hypothetical protein